MVPPRFTAYPCGYLHEHIRKRVTCQFLRQELIGKTQHLSKSVSDRFGKMLCFSYKYALKIPQSFVCTLLLFMHPIFGIPNRQSLLDSIQSFTVEPAPIKCICLHCVYPAAICISRT